MIAISGKTIQAGVAAGPVYIYRREDTQPNRRSALTEEEEWARYLQASRQAAEQLKRLQEASSCRLGKDLAAIFQVQSALLEDPDFIEAVQEWLRRGVSAEYAVRATGEECAALLMATQDNYMRARAADVQDVARRLGDILSGQVSTLSHRPGILLADDLSPSEAVALDTRSLLGIVSCHGSSNSHTAILSRAMGIPSLTGVKIDAAWEGKIAVIDGDRGRLYIDPDEDTLADALSRQKIRQEAHQRMLAKAKEPCCTKDGHKVCLCANIGTPQEALAACEYGCQGVGLFRSEYLYMGRESCPTEEEQFIAYQQTVLAMNGKKVVIRTLDVGADKQLPCLEPAEESNPALGCRGIRYSLAHPDLFRQQLRAILRAAAFGPVAVMFPMVSCVEEIRCAKVLLEQCETELKEQGMPCGTVEVGTMIETPAAVVMADELAREVSFFSLGTNDLLQYTLAADRTNASLDSLFKLSHPALLRMIRHTVKVGHRRGCWVGICGELASDPSMTRTLLQMGFDELSVSPSALLTVRDKISTITLRRAQPVG